MLIMRIKQAKRTSLFDDTELFIHEELYARKFENLDEMDKFLEKYNLPKLNEEEAQSLNRPVMTDEIETVIQKLVL